MDFLNRPTPEDAELAEFARSLRATLVSAPPAEQAKTLVPRLAEEARIAHAQRPAGADRTEPRSRLETLGQLALGFCLVPLVAAGLATAGVKLPGPAQSAFESVGIDLPNQGDKGSDEPSAPPATSPSDGAATPPAASPGAGNANPGKGDGKAKGRGNGKAKGQPQAPGQSGSAGSNGNGSGSSASPGKSGSAPGQSKAGGSSSSGNGKASGGGSGSGNAVGQTGATPPGQAKPESPGNSAQAPGHNK